MSLLKDISNSDITNNNLIYPLIKIFKNDKMKSVIIAAISGILLLLVIIYLIFLNNIAKQEYLNNYPELDTQTLNKLKSGNDFLIQLCNLNLNVNEDGYILIDNSSGKSFTAQICGKYGKAFYLKDPFQDIYVTVDENFRVRLSNEFTQVRFMPVTIHHKTLFAASFIGAEQTHYLCLDQFEHVILEKFHPKDVSKVHNCNIKLKES